MEPASLAKLQICFFQILFSEKISGMKIKFFYGVIIYERKKNDASKGDILLSAMWAGMPVQGDIFIGPYCLQ